MNALAGFWAWRGDADPIASCRRMLFAQKLYGPGRTMTAQHGDAALGRNLFALLPEDGFDRQPLQGVSGGVLVADVRLDNRADLCRDLAVPLGERNLLADAVLLGLALEAWGEAALDRLVGDFAFALWNQRDQRLLLARDYLGQRPLVYHQSPRFFAFASMAKGLHALPDVPYAADRQMMAEFSATVPECGSRTFFASIEKVEPGHFVSVTRDGITRRRYWSAPSQTIRLRTSEEYAEALREKMDLAVQARLRGAGEAIGAQLSAGLDSGTVVATAARLLANSGKVISFTAVPGQSHASRRDVICDEGPLAAATAALYPNIEHVLVKTGGASPVSSLDRNFFIYERPVLNLANWTWVNAINAAARERGLSVMLTGRMGNLGFSHAGMDLLPLLLRRGRLMRFAREAALLKRGGVRWGTIGSQTFGPFLPRPLWRLVRMLRGLGGDVTSYTLINPTALEELKIVARAAAQGLDLSYRPPMNGCERRAWALGRVDPGNYNKGMLAEWGIDHRDPTADRRLMEFCLSVPVGEFLRDGIPRALARRAFRDRLPSVVIDERRKGYQAADWREGFAAARPEIVTEIERIRQCRMATQVLNLDMMQALAGKDLPAGKTVTAARLHRLALLRAISNGHFLRRASGVNG